MAYDFKKEMKHLYMPGERPEIVDVPTAHYIAVRGQGDPNEADGEYKHAIPALYAVAYTLKMSSKGDYRMYGFYDYVVPPLEGFWWQEGVHGVDYANRASFHWISVIRLPDFVTPRDVAWAAETAANKKKTDCSRVEFLTMQEGLCAQILHIGPYDEEPRSVAAMHTYIAQQGYVPDLNDQRMHHEIYLSDPQKVAPERWKTVIRHPIRKA